jgi:hypothetical protein
MAELPATTWSDPTRTVEYSADTAVAIVDASAVAIVDASAVALVDTGVTADYLPATVWSGDNNS